MNQSVGGSILRYLLSAIIPTKNRHEMLKNVITSFIYQDIEKPIEFIIVDQSDAKIEKNKLEELNEISRIVHKDSILRYYYNPNLSGLTAAKNFGVTKALSDIVLFLDDDLILMPGFLQNLMKGFELGFDGVSGVQIQDVGSQSIFSELYSRIFYRGYLKDIRRKVNRNYWKLDDFIDTNVLSGGLTAYKKSYVEDLKFDENLVKYCLGEDKEFSLRAKNNNLKLAICTKAHVFHSRHPKGKPDLYKRYQGKTSLINYLQTKNENIKWDTKISSLWALFGIILEALLMSLLKFSVIPIKGALIGIIKSNKEFKELDFIKPK